MHGRGWLGFSKRIVKDTKIEAKWTTHYDNVKREGTSYPFTFLPKTEEFETKLDSGVIVVKTISTSYSIHKPLDAGGAFSVVPNEIVQTHIENGVVVRQLRETNIRYDLFDNVTHREQFISKSKKYHIVWDIEYADEKERSERWLLGLIKRIEETSTSDSGKTQRRRTDYTPNLSTGLIDRVIVEPDDTTKDFYLSTNYVRNSNGLIESVIREDFTGKSRRINITYDVLEGKLASSITNDLGHVTNLVYHPGLGVLVEQQNPDGTTKRWKYDRFGRIRREETSPYGPKISINYLKYVPKGPSLVYSFDSLTQVKTVQDGYIEMNRYFDQLGRCILQSMKSFDEKVMIEKSFAYNDNYPNKYAYISQQHFSDQHHSPLSEYRYIEFEYDRLGRLVRQGLPGLWNVRTVYDSLKTTVYNDSLYQEGYVVEDELGRVTESVSILTEEPSKSKHDVLTTYQYGPFNHHEQIIDHFGNRIVLEYDHLGRCTKFLDPNTGETTFKYNAFGNLREKTDANLVTTTYLYDNIGRLESSKSKYGNTFFVWDNAPNGIGRVASSLRSK